MCRDAPAGMWGVAALATASGTTALAAPPIQQLGEIVVIGVTPLPGLGLRASQVPLNTQGAQADDVAEVRGQSITDLLQQSFQGVSITRSQGNPWQGNLYFHGYMLSPLQGSSSGMSIYMDGVRQNQPFAEAIVAPGAPRGYFVGMSYRFGKEGH